MYFSLKFQVTAHHCRADRGGTQTIEPTVRGKGRLNRPLLVCFLAMHPISFLYSDNPGPHEGDGATHIQGESSQTSKQLKQPPPRRHTGQPDLDNSSLRRHRRVCVVANWQPK